MTTHLKEGLTVARLRIDLTLTAGEESVWSISTGEAEADDAETLIEKLISMALPERSAWQSAPPGAAGDGQSASRGAYTAA